MQPLRHLLCIALLLIVVGCNASTLPSPDVRLHKAKSRAQHHGFTQLTIKMEPFSLPIWQRVTVPGQTVRVYIEGDGLAWVTSRRRSNDPTPINPVALTLALSDPSPNVVYIGRPCQYGGVKTNKNCTSDIWTDKRFDDPIVELFDDSLNHMQVMWSNPDWELIGYSGGAAIALLLTDKRHDIASIRTVAGNLVPKWINEWHGVSPMPSAGNPLAIQALRSVAQLHFYGVDDTVVPPKLIRRYQTAMDSRCVEIHPVEDANHWQKWETQWPVLLEKPFYC